MKIGFTERGDAGLDFSWVEKCKNHQVDGAVVITKNLNPTCRGHILELHAQQFPLIVHVGCTGWGGTIVEPNVPDFHTQLENLRALLDDSFPIENCVLRVDPIFPTPKGIARVLKVLDTAESTGLLDATDLHKLRIRISVLDEYQHVKQRFYEMGQQPIYGPKDFYAPWNMMNALCDALAGTKWEFETCAEHQLASMAPGLFIEQGCLSQEDLKRMGLTWGKTFENGQQRSGCHCLGCKTELLSCKARCAHQCAYCYWKG